MGLISRMNTIVKSKINRLLNRYEDSKEKPVNLSDVEDKLEIRMNKICLNYFQFWRHKQNAN